MEISQLLRELCDLQYYDHYDVTTSLHHRKWSPILLRYTRLSPIYDTSKFGSNISINKKVYIGLQVGGAGVGLVGSLTIFLIYQSQKPNRFATPTLKLTPSNLIEIL